MITIHSDTFIPYEFPEIEQVYKFIIERCMGIKKSLKFMEITNEHLYVRCPVVGDYLEVVGTVNEITKLNDMLTKNNWYRLT